MHRKKIAVTAMTAALLMAAGVSSATATSSNANDGKTTICHYRGNGTFKEITVANSSLPAHRRHHGGRDIIPAPAGGCSTVTPPPPFGDGGEDHHGCIASSESGDSTQTQHGFVNVGNINLGLNNVLGNAFCQADVVNGLAVSLIGPALGGSSLGSGLLSGGPLGLLSGAPEYLLSGLTTDIRVLASVLVQF